MKIALLSDYSIEDYHSLGREKYWSTPKGIYDALLTDKRVNEVKWYPLPFDDQIYGFQELMKVYNRSFTPDIIFWMSCEPTPAEILFI